MSTTSRCHGPSSIRLVAGATVAEFIREGDRWRHEVTTASGRWVSLEGPESDEGDPAWPASPVLVEVAVAESAAGAVVLGMGLSGRSHFSLSASACPQRPDTILFEAACRIQGPAGWLGSAYRAVDGTIVRIAARPAAPPATIAWSYAIGPAGIDAAAPGPLGAPR